MPNIHHDFKKSKKLESERLHDSPIHELDVFLCYRRNDGSWHAEWLYQHLNGIKFTDPDRGPCQFHVYYDKAAPGVADWKKLHFPTLQKSKALIVVCTPGISKDLSKSGRPDWVYKELSWWTKHRRKAPIVVDGTGEGERWLPDLVLRKWPDINRIQLIKDERQTGDPAFIDRVRDRIAGAIRESERGTVFEDLERFKKLTRRLSIAIAGALLLFLGAAVASYIALRFSRDATTLAIEATTARDIAKSRELASAAIFKLNVDPELAVLLALHALDYAVTKEAEAALHKALDSSRQRLSLPHESQFVSDVTFSPDGAILATINGNKLFVWDLATGEIDGTFADFQKPVNAVSFSPDGTRIATAIYDGNVPIFDRTTGEELMVLPAQAGRYGISNVVFSPDGTRLAVVGGYPNTWVWDVRTGKKLTTLRGHSDGISSIAFSPDGKYLATASADGTVRTWDATTGNLLNVLAGHISSVSAVAWSPNGKHLASGSQDLTVREWDANTGKMLTLLTGHSDYVTDVAYGTDGILASASEDGTVQVREAIESGQLHMRTRKAVRFTLYGHGADGPQSSINAVTFSADGKYLATGGSDFTARIWDVELGEELVVYTDHNRWATAAAFDPDGARIASTNEYGRTRIWNANTGETLLTLPETISAGKTVVWSPDGKYLATAGPESKASVWNAQTGEMVLTLKDPTPSKLRGWDDASCIAYSSDGTRIAVVTDDVRLWDSKTGEELLVIEQPSARCVAFSPNDSYLASTGYKGEMLVWDIITGKKLLETTGHDRGFTLDEDIEFSPDGTRIAVVANDGVRVRNAATGKLLLFIKVVNWGFKDIAFSPDGTRLATVSDNLRVWDSDTGELRFGPIGNVGEVNSVNFSSDGKRLVSAMSDGTVRVYAADINLLKSVARSRVERSLTETECLQYLQGDRCSHSR